MTDGEFLMNHPVLVDDLAEMPVGDLSFQRMQPFDVIERGRFIGPHLVLDCGGSAGRFELPANIRFLRRVPDVIVEGSRYLAMMLNHSSILFFHTGIRLLHVKQFRTVMSSSCL